MTVFFFFLSATRLLYSSIQLHNSRDQRHVRYKFLLDREWTENRTIETQTNYENMSKDKNETKVTSLCVHVHVCILSRRNSVGNRNARIVREYTRLYLFQMEYLRYLTFHATRHVSVYTLALPLNIAAFPCRKKRQNFRQ